MIEAGVNGCLFAKGQTLAMADALDGLLNDLTAARAMGQRARAWVQRHRTWRQSAAVVTAAYEAAVARRRSSCALAAQESTTVHRG
jgi:glycosyltransferase involved in cell wall biosynthesis